MRHKYCAEHGAVLYCQALEGLLKGRLLLGAAPLVALLAWTGSALAGPFSEVPTGQGAYSEATTLARAGLLRSQDERALSSRATLSRYDFAILLLEPLAVLEKLGRGSPPEAIQSSALRAFERVTPAERRRLGLAIARLTREFGDVMRLIGEPYRAGLSAADTMGSTGQLPGIGRRASSTAASVLPALSARLRGARIDLGYRRASGESMPLEYVAATRFAPAVSSPSPPGGAENRPLLSNLGLSGLRASVEYGVADDLRLILAYEALLREEAGKLTRDPTRLGSLGLAYRLSGSTDVRLNYGLIARLDENDTVRVQDRLASAELTVRF